jgi:hypothetical protein
LKEAENPAASIARSPQLPSKEFSAQAPARDVSNSGICFVAPPQIPADVPVEMELVLPHEVTHQGPSKIHFSAKPIRKQPLKNSQRQGSKHVGVAALRIGPQPVSANHPPGSIAWPEEGRGLFFEDGEKPAVLHPLGGARHLCGVILSVEVISSWATAEVD